MFTTDKKDSAKKETVLPPDFFQDKIPHKAEGHSFEDRLT